MTRARAATFGLKHPTSPPMPSAMQRCTSATPSAPATQAISGNGEAAVLMAQSAKRRCSAVIQPSPAQTAAGQVKPPWRPTQSRMRAASGGTPRVPRHLFRSGSLPPGRRQSAISTMMLAVPGAAAQTRWANSCALERTQSTILRCFSDEISDAQHCPKLCGPSSIVSAHFCAASSGVGMSSVRFIRKVFAPSVSIVFHFHTRVLVTQQRWLSWPSKATADRHHSPASASSPASQNSPDPVLATQ